MSAKKANKEDLGNAVRVVNKAISDLTERLETIASTEEQHPIMIEGVTQTNYDCQLMVDPSFVAKVFLRYQYPLYHVLGLDAPDEMWEELGREYGLKYVSLADLYLGI